MALTGILQGIEADEKCVRILDIAPKAFESTPDLLFFTQNGLVKRSAATEYAVRRCRLCQAHSRRDAGSPGARRQGRKVLWLQ